MRHWRLTCTFLLALGCGSSGGDSSDGGDGGRPLNLIDDPQPHSGGGVGSGEIEGELNVFVVDSRTDELIGGAEVYIGDGYAGTLPTGTTNSDGLVIFREGTMDGGGVVHVDSGSLSGPQVVTATISNYAAATWFGVNGAVVTIPLDPIEEDSGDVPTARVTGTIVGWDDLPDPPSGSALVAFVQYTYTESADGAENSIPQDAGPIDEIPELTANTCYKIPDFFLDSCDWVLNTRTGKQAIYAVVARVNLQTGLFEILGFAAQTGYDLTEDETLGGEELEFLDPMDAREVEIRLDEPPRGLSQIGWLAAIDLGEEGQLVVPSLDGGDTVLVPGATGELSGTYLVTARATNLAGDAIPTSLIVEYDPDLDGPVDLGDWLSLPDDIMVDQDVEPNTYTFDRVDGASVHMVSLDDTDGTPAWRVLILMDPPGPPPAEDGGLDGGADAGPPPGPGPVITFTLPALSPDPLPLGNIEMTVGAMDVSGFDPLNFEVEAIDAEAIRRQSADQDKYRRE